MNHLRSDEKFLRERMKNQFSGIFNIPIAPTAADDGDGDDDDDDADADDDAAAFRPDVASVDVGL